MIHKWLYHHYSIQLLITNDLVLKTMSNITHSSVMLKSKRDIDKGCQLVVYYSYWTIGVTIIPVHVVFIYKFR